MFNWFTNLRMAPKLIGSFVLVALLAALVGGAGFMGLQTMQSKLDSITTTATPSLVYLLRAESDVNNAIRFTRGAIMSVDKAEIASFAGKAAAAEADAWQQFQQFQAMPQDGGHTSDVRAQAADLFQKWLPLDDQARQLGVTNTTASNAAAAKISLGPEMQVAIPLTNALQELVTINQQSLNSQAAQGRAAGNTAVTQLAVVVVLAMLLAIVLGLLIARSIAGPIRAVQAVLTSVTDRCVTYLEGAMLALANNDLTVVVTSVTKRVDHQGKDEIGQTAAVTNRLLGKVQALIGSYEQARTGLQELIGDVATTSQQVDSGATQLAQATEQIGQASTQIARAIEEVAQGTGEQSRSASEATSQMSEFATAVAQVSSGAEAQSRAVQQATGSITQLRAALTNTTERVRLVIDAADRAATTAREGGAAVSKTIASIDGVRSAVSRSAAQVHALGERSREVGQIVEAIDDIAEQTNLLALNAAIEAARAGEHGRGFTVVAAEVRKLAERASNETKEITKRITAIQQQVAEVVAAMEAGNAEVAQSAALGQQAGSALESILGVVAETTTQVRGIGSAVEQMVGSVEEVSSAAANVATVATQTVQATGQMRAGSDRIGAAIESIAAVSEQSAAGAEEVSASTEEQTASVEEMSAGAQELAALAAQLQELVGRFVVDAKQPSQPVELRQRAAGRPAPQPPVETRSLRRA